jgi:hypothetical protein
MAEYEAPVSRSWSASLSTAPPGLRRTGSVRSRGARAAASNLPERFLDPFLGTRTLSSRRGDDEGQT